MKSAIHRAVLLACSTMIAAPAWAQVRYDIPAGTLDQVLNRFAVSAGILLSFDGAHTAGKTSAGLSGNYTVTGALQALLARHGLEALPANGGGYVVRVIGEHAAGDAALPAVTVSAQAERSDSTEGSGSYRQAGRSRSATGLELAPEETPQSLSIITRQRLDDQRLVNIMDVVDATIGLSSFRMSVGADLGQPSARGFTVSNFLIDGIPSLAGSGGDRANTVIYDRIEVLRGANGPTSGMGYPGASINMVRKRPAASPQDIVSVEAGSWDRYGAGIDVSRPLSASGNVRGRFVLDHKQQKSWIDRYQGKTSVAYGIVEADLGPETLLTVGFSHQTNDNDSPLRSGIPLYYADGGKIGLPHSFNPSPTWSYYNTTDSSVFASLQHNFSNGWKGQVEATFLRDSYDAVAPYAYGAIDRATGMGLSMTTAHWDEVGKQYSLDSSLRGQFNALGRAHDLLMGFSAARRRNDSVDTGGWLYGWNSSYDGTITSPVWDWNGTQVNAPQFTRKADGRTTRTDYSAYLTTRLNLTDSTKLIAGARVLTSETVSNTLTVAGVATRSERKDSGIIIPYTGVIQKLDERWSLYGSYSKIFRSQSLSILDVNRKPLDAEEGDAYEAGLKGLVLQDRLSVNLSLFSVRQKKVAEYDPLTMAYRQLEGIRTKGAEVELAGELARGWNLSAGYAYSISEDKNGVRVMERTPKNTVKTFTTYQLPGELRRWTVGGDFTWQSRYGWDDARSSGWDYQQSFTLASLMARYQLSETTDISLNLQNAFDKRYFTGIADMGTYGAPRNIMATLKHRF